ncbi:MAG TPA: LysE family translocator [Devosiaceae bacterium]
MSPTILIALLSAAIPSYFTPGPNNLMLMTSSARFGMGRTVPHALGIVAGFPFMVFVVGLGLGEVFVLLPWLKTALQFAAAAYFLWMAWHLLGFSIGNAKGGERPLRFHEAAMFQWINPKAWAMAASFVVLAVEPGTGHMTSLLHLTAICLAIAPLSCATWMAFGQQLQSFLQRSGLQRHLGAVLAGLMLLAVVLFLV